MRATALSPISHRPSGLAAWVAILLVLTTASAPRTASAQSLADIARKEEARRKAQPQPAKVYTNSDLTPAPPVTATSAGGSSTDAQGSSTTSSSTPATGANADAKGASGADSKDDKDKGTKDQAYWANRIKALREALDHDTTFADALQSRINALTTDFVNRDDPAQRSVIERDRQKALAELDRLKQQVIADRAAIANLEEEARHAGVPPGWLR